MTLARSSWAEVIYEGKDISVALAPYLLGVTYTDHKGGKADELSLSLQNRAGLWSGDWLPNTGDTIQARLHADDWGEGGGSLFCGTFTVDKLRLSGPPSVAVLSGLSLPPGLAARKTKRHRAWESATLQTIAGDVASLARMPLVFDAEDTAPIFRVEQRGETDLAFLDRLCGEYDLALKVHDGQLVIWSIQTYGEKEPVTTYTLGESRVLGWDLEVKAYIWTPRVKVVYQDPLAGKVQQSDAHFSADPDDPLGVGVGPQSFDEDAAEVLRSACRSKAEAEAKAKARLQAQQRHKAEGSLTVMGDVRLVAGNCIALVGWGKLDGKYMVDDATHTRAEGYTVQAKVSRVAA